MPILILVMSIAAGAGIYIVSQSHAASQTGAVDYVLVTVRDQRTGKVVPDAIIRFRSTNNEYYCRDLNGNYANFVPSDGNGQVVFDNCPLSRLDGNGYPIDYYYVYSVSLPAGYTAISGVGNPGYYYTLYNNPFHIDFDFVVQSSAPSPPPVAPPSPSPLPPGPSPAPTPSPRPSPQPTSPKPGGVTIKPASPAVPQPSSPSSSPSSVPVPPPPPDDAIDVFAPSVETTTLSTETTLTSDDKKVTIVLPAGALEANSLCAITPIHPTDAPVKLKTIEGAYSLSCKDAAGHDITVFTQTVRIAMKVSKTFPASSYITYAKGDVWGKLPASFNKKTNTVGFTLDTPSLFLVSRSPSSIISVLITLVVLAVVGGIGWLGFILFRNRRRAAQEASYVRPEYISPRVSHSSTEPHAHSKGARGGIEDYAPPSATTPSVTSPKSKAPGPAPNPSNSKNEYDPEHGKY